MALLAQKYINKFIIWNCTEKMNITLGNNISLDDDR